MKRSNPLTWVVVLLLFGISAGVWYWNVLGTQVEHRFRAYQASAPSRIYARAPVLHRGMDVAESGLALHLDRAGYRIASNTEVSSGEYLIGTGEWTIGIRPFVHANGPEAGRKVIVHLDGNGRISGLSNAAGNELGTVRIEPAEIGAFIPADGKDSIPVRLEEVPEHLINAVLVTEDRRFYNHNGIDLRRIAGALLANLSNRRIVQGASTITQQLVKNLYLTRERTLARKAREVLIAWMLELRHSKQEILEAYLNVLYLGQDGATAIHGVGLAAHYYFGKNIQDLGLPEAAMLAGLIRSPSNHTPLRHPEAAHERRNFVLAQMLQQQNITSSEYQSAVESGLDLRPPFERTESASYFVDYLRKELTRRYGNETLEKGGLSIYTTLDLRMQELAERILQKRLEELEQGTDQLKDDRSPMQGAMVVLEPRTAQILVLIGGRDYKQSPFNRALAMRQPGSIFKPVVMLTALARRNGSDPAFTLASVLKDEPFLITVPNIKWEPMNHDKSFRGEVTVREALERSLNVPMVQLGAAVGYTQIISTARRMGITSPLEPVPSLPIGSFEVTMLEMARAYAVLASGGIRAPLRSILRIVKPDGSSFRMSEAKPFRIFRSAEIYLVTSALQGAIDRGTSTHLRDLGYFGAAAGKTGSTNRFRDAWFIGYTPEIVVGGWVGFDVSRDLGMAGSEAALPIGADFMIGVLGRNGAARFTPPAGIERVRVAINKGGTCHHLHEFFLSGTAPQSNCLEQKKIHETQPTAQPVKDVLQPES
ncbi:MAG: PBP1A family penicillin-binding protein [Pseudomonadota bacterium]